MGVRPNLCHIIGIQQKEAYKKVKEYYNEHWADDLYELTKSLWEVIEEDQDFIREITSGLMLQDILYIPRSPSLEIIGILPVYHHQEARLYNHDLLWTMVEAKALGEEPKVVRIPYEDLSDCIGMDIKEIRNKHGLFVARDFQYYRGDWGRKYAHQRLETYDEDFGFAQVFLQSIGFTFEKEELNRYLVFEWC